MKRASTTLAILGVVLVLGMAPSLLGDEQCSVRSTAGDYGYTVTGTRLPVGPAASVGWVRFESDGTLAGTQTLSIGGNIVQGEVLTGTFLVNPDCTSSATIVVSNTPFPRTAHLDIVWTDSSREAHFIFADTGLILTGRATRIHHGSD